MRTRSSWHRLFRAATLAATLCGATQGSARAGLDPASIRETPLGPPTGLRTDLVLDRAALAGWGVPRPSALAFDGEGALYILDASSRRVVKVDARGTFLHSVGGYGDDDASLTLPEEIAVDRFILPRQFQWAQILESIRVTLFIYVFHVNTQQ